MNRYVSLFGAMVALLVGCAQDPGPAPDGAGPPSLAGVTGTSGPGKARGRRLDALGLPEIKKVMLCPPHNPDEDTNPQARSIRGGCLGNFQHFYADGGGVPPAKLGPEVTGYHYKLGELRVTLKPSDAVPCVTGDTPLYDVSVETGAGPLNICRSQKHSGTYGRQCSPQQYDALDDKAVAVPGAWNIENGRHMETVDGKKVFTLACMSGVAAKCALNGYPPWGNKDGQSLQDHFMACVQAQRAQYAGQADSTSHTCPGTRLDTSDNLGIQQGDGGLTLEAAWTKDGVYCKGQPRYPACATASALEGVRRCDEAELRPDNFRSWPAGVLLVTRSTGDNKAYGEQCPSALHICG
jgi:hypothetical protein